MRPVPSDFVPLRGSRHQGRCDDREYSDTVGYAYHDEFGDLIRMLLERVPGPTHCHNDLGRRRQLPSGERGCASGRMRHQWA